MLIKLLISAFGTAAAIAETIANLIVAAAQLIYAFTQQPASCSLLSGSGSSPSIAQYSGAAPYDRVAVGSVEAVVDAVVAGIAARARAR